MNEERLSRLPKWAQEHIERLSTQHARLEERYEALREELVQRGMANTPVTVRTFENVDFGLGQDDEVVYTLDAPGLRSRDMRVTAHPDMSAISVSGDRPLRVHPAASNRIEISLAPD